MGTTGWVFDRQPTHILICFSPPSVLIDFCVFFTLKIYDFTIFIEREYKLMENKHVYIPCEGF
jgi:hypothetical protein